MSGTVNEHACYRASTGDNLLLTPCFKHVHSSLHDKDTYHIMTSSSGFTAASLLSHNKIPTKQCVFFLQPSCMEATPTFAQINGATMFVKNFGEPYCDDTRHYVTTRGLVKVSSDTAHFSTSFCMPTRYHQPLHLS